MQCAALFLLGCALYAGSLGHEWAFDDPLVYPENPAVQEGLSGVPRILTTDLYAHLYERMDRPAELSGGRYRPLSLITFAFENELFGNRPLIAHAGNVLLYACTLPLLLLLLRRWRPERPEWALAATALFAVHPIHTEVVANVKSRDEILSLLFLLASLFLVWAAFQSAQMRLRERFSRGADLSNAESSPRLRVFVSPSPVSIDRREVGSLVLSGVCAFLALMSKEYAVSLLVLAPLMLYVLAKAPLRTAVRFTGPIAVAVVAYFWLRVSVVGLPRVEAVDLLNDPYLLATSGQAWATKLFVLLAYLRLLVWPHPLSADYSYRQIAYRDFQDPLVWVAILSLVVGIGVVWIGIRRKHWAGFAAAFYLVHLFLISNFVVEIGATMGERLVYHASVGFVMLLAGGLTSQWGGRRAASQPPVRGSRALLLVAVVLGIVLTWNRVPDWRNDVTLFTHDVAVVPESARVNANAGRGFLLLSDDATDPARRQALLEQAQFHLEKSLEIDSEIVMAYFTLGVVHDRREEYEALERSWNQARARFPDHPLFATYDPILADRLARLAAKVSPADHGRARQLLERAVEYDSGNASFWFYLGTAREADGDSWSARSAWREALRLDPSLHQAAEALRRVTSEPAESGNSRSND